MGQETTFPQVKLLSYYSYYNNNNNNNNILASKPKTKIQTEWQQTFHKFNIILNSSCLYFRFATVIPKNLNFATLPTNLLAILIL